MENKADKIKRQLDANKYGLLMSDSNINEEPTNVFIELNDGSVHKFGNIKSNAFIERFGGIYSITSQFDELYIFPMSSIKYIRKWSPKEVDDGK